MARTTRRNSERDKKKLDAVADSKKIAPYGLKTKFAVDKSSGKLGFSRLGKLVTKNANRSIKKAARAAAKKEIRDHV